MPEKRSAVQKSAAAAPAENPAAGPPTDELAAPPRTQVDGSHAGSPPEEEIPAGLGTAAKTTGTKSAAVRMLTRSVAGKKPAVEKGEAQRVADTAKPTQMPKGGGRRGPRRGASKGR